MKSIKTALLLVLSLGSLFAVTGCASPAYSAQERHAQIARNWDYEGKQATDDWDHILLLRPPSRLTIWNVR